MWILPKTHQLSSHFALDMVASKEDLTLQELNIESSLMWRSKPSPVQTWLRRWKRISWLQHLSGRILKPSQHKSFETRLTSSLAATHVSHFQRQESELERMTLDTSGLTSGDTSNQSDLFGASLRTSRDTSVSDSEKSLKTWKALVTQRRGEYLARLKSARLTSESESTSWGTPTATDANPIRGGELYQTKSGTVRAKNKDGTTSQRGLIEQVMFPTPTAAQGGGERSGDRKGTGNLNYMARKNWPTPTARDHKGGYKGGRIRNGKVSRDTLDVAVQHTDNKSQSAGSLNPTWVEWLMGVPTGLTDLGSWGTE